MPDQETLHYRKPTKTGVPDHHFRSAVTYFVNQIRERTGDVEVALEEYLTQPGLGAGEQRMARMSAREHARQSEQFLAILAALTLDSGILPGKDVMGVFGWPERTMHTRTGPYREETTGG